MRTTNAWQKVESAESGLGFQRRRYCSARNAGQLVRGHSTSKRTADAGTKPDADAPAVVPAECHADARSDAVSLHVADLAAKPGTKLGADVGPYCAAIAAPIRFTNSFSDRGSDFKTKRHPHRLAVPRAHRLAVPNSHVTAYA